jgi:hypothetical protein
MTNSEQIAALARHLLAVALASILIASPAHAQNRAVIVVVPDDFPAIDARAIVLRERDRDVLLLPPDGADVDALAVSLAALRRARQREVSPSVGEMIPITGFAVTAEAAPGERARLSRVLERLAQKPTTSIGDFGPGRWILYRGR